MGPKEHKKKKSYTIMLISNSGGGIKQRRVTARSIGTGIGLVLAVLAIAIAFGVFSTMQMLNGNVGGSTLKTELEELTKQNGELTTRNEELNNKITILSDTINAKVEKEEIAAAEDAQKSIPTGFPLSGTAKMEEANANEAAGEGAPVIPMIIFEAAANTSVIAAGDGRVSYVGPDDTDYGNMIKIDHGNGYISIYRNAAEMKVAEGDEVKRGTLLFEMGENSTKLGYEIMNQDQFIEPLTVLDIAG